MWTASLAERAKNAFAYARQYVQEQQLGERFDSSGRGGSGASWGTWARDWNAALRPATEGKEEVSLVPGWAARVPRPGPCVEGVRPFDIHLWVSGYAASTRSLAEATRGQRALVSLAKRDIDHATEGARRSSVGYAALPRPFDGTPVATAESEDFPTKPSRPDHISTLATPAHESSRPRSDTIEATDISFKLPNIAQIANRNLDMRLSPFWSKPLALRPIRISVEPPPDHRTVHSSGHCADQESGAEPLLIVGSSTDGQGHFAHRLIIPWERLRAHSSWPHSSDMSQIDRQKWRLRVSVRLEGSKLPVSVSTYATNARPMTSQERHIADATPDGSSRLLLGSQEPQQNSVVGPSNISPVLSSLPPDDQGVCQAAESHLDMAVQSDGGIRIISDLDDTVKHSDILAGGRETFRNVFCRPLSEICVPGASELFRAAKQAGAAGFHFVCVTHFQSNSPFELLPSIREFLAEHRFPNDYSLKLKYYGGRSLLTALFESPADRKRPAIVDILDSFPTARFILFGDSGEQDLELYVSIALERPAQVAAIYIRDISSGRELPESLSRGQSTPDTYSPPGGTTPVPSRTNLPLSPSENPKQEQDGFQGGYNASPPSSDSSTTDEIEIREELQALSAAQQKILRRAAAWRSRLEQARWNVPESVELVVFRDIQEITPRVVRQISDLS